MLLKSPHLDVLRLCLCNQIFLVLVAIRYLLLQVFCEQSHLLYLCLKLLIDAFSVVDLFLVVLLILLHQVTQVSNLVLSLVQLLSRDVDLLLGLLKVSNQTLVHLSLLLQVLKCLAVLYLLSLVLVYNSPNVLLDALELVL